MFWYPLRCTKASGLEFNILNDYFKYGVIKKLFNIPWWVSISGNMIDAAKYSVNFGKLRVENSRNVTVFEMWLHNKFWQN